MRLSVKVSASDDVFDFCGGGVILPVTVGYVSVPVTVSVTRSVRVRGVDRLSVSVEAFSEKLWFDAPMLALAVDVTVSENATENDLVGGGVIISDSVAVMSSEAEHVRAIDALCVTDTYGCEKVASGVCDRVAVGGGVTVPLRLHVSTEVFVTE